MLQVLNWFFNWSNELQYDQDCSYTCTSCIDSCLSVYMWSMMRHFGISLNIRLDWINIPGNIMANQILYWISFISLHCDQQDQKCCVSHVQNSSILICLRVDCIGTLRLYWHNGLLLSFKILLLRSNLVCMCRTPRMRCWCTHGTGSIDVCLNVTVGSSEYWDIFVSNIEHSAKGFISFCLFWH